LKRGKKGGGSNRPLRPRLLRHGEEEGRGLKKGKGGSERRGGGWSKVGVRPAAG